MKNILGIFLCLCLSLLCEADLFAQLDGTYAVTARLTNINRRTPKK